MSLDLSAKTDQELTNLIENHRRKKALTAPLYLEALAERERRRHNGLEFSKSRDIILAAAREGRCVSYKELADASGAEWTKVHYAMNHHLWELVSWAHGHGYPMLSAVVVNQENVNTRTMRPETLKGFITAAEELERTDIGTDHQVFLHAEQERVFRWAREYLSMSFAIEGNTGPWEVVVGMEVHAQVISRAKLFSGAATDFGAPPNTQVSFVDAAFPGMLPVINRECVAQAVRTGLGLNAHIHLVSRFDRKNYFYADLPAGYQISQYQHPIVGEGRIEIELTDGSTREIGITRLHLEQDAGKSLHDQHPTKSYIDLNRAGVGVDGDRVGT